MSVNGAGGLSPIDWTKYSQNSNVSSAEQIQTIQNDIATCVQNKADAQSQITIAQAEQPATTDQGEQEQVDQITTALASSQTEYAAAVAEASTAASAAATAASNASSLAAVAASTPQTIQQQTGTTEAGEPIYEEVSNPAYEAAQTAAQEAQTAADAAQQTAQAAQARAEALQQLCQEMQTALSSLEAQPDDASEEETDHELEALREQVDTYNQEIEQLNAQLDQVKATNAQTQGTAAEAEATPHDMRDASRGKIIKSGTQIQNGVVTSVDSDTLDTDVYYDNRGSMSKEEYYGTTAFSIMSDVGTYSGAVDSNGNITDSVALANSFATIASTNGITVNYTDEQFLNGVTTDQLQSYLTTDEMTALFPNGENDDGSAAATALEAAFTQNPSEWPDDKKDLYAKLYSLGVSYCIAQTSWNGQAGDDLISLNGVQSAQATATPDGNAAVEGAAAAGTDAESEDAGVSAPENLSTNPDNVYGIQIDTQGNITIAGIEGLTSDNPADLEALQSGKARKYTLKDSGGRDVAVEINQDGVITVTQQVDSSDNESSEDENSEKSTVQTVYNSANNTYYETITDTEGNIKESKIITYDDEGAVTSWENKEYFKDNSAKYNTCCKVTNSDGSYIQKASGDKLSYFDANDMYELDSPEQAILATKVIKTYQDNNAASLSPSEKLMMQTEGVPTLNEAIEGIKSGEYDENTDFASMVTGYNPDLTNFAELSEADQQNVYQMMEYYDMLQTVGIDNLSEEDSQIIEDFEKYLKFLFGHGTFIGDTSNLKGNMRNLCDIVGIDMSPFTAGAENQNTAYNNNSYDNNIEFTVTTVTDTGITVTTTYNTSPSIGSNSPAAASAADAPTEVAEDAEAQPAEEDQVTEAPDTEAAEEAAAADEPEQAGEAEEQAYFIEPADSEHEAADAESADEADEEPKTTSYDPSFYFDSLDFISQTFPEISESESQDIAKMLDDYNIVTINPTSDSQYTIQRNSDGRIYVIRDY